jgi:DNA polymerase-3 subunit delta
VADLALGGDVRGLSEALARLPSGDKDVIPIVRSLQRRLLMLAPLRARVDSGERAQAVMTSIGKSLFWKDKDTVGVQVGRWRSDLIARTVTRLAEAERQVMSAGGPGLVDADAELFAICRQAARLH